MFLYDQIPMVYVFINIVQFDAIDNDGNTNDIMYVKSL